MNDAEEGQFRADSYNFSHTSSAPRMPPADAASLHGYPPPPPVAAMSYGGPTWHPPPSPYDSHEHRSTPPDLPQHANAPQPYAAPSREHSTYVPDPTYSRAGSISAPNRSPGDGSRPHFQSVNGAVHESQYQPQPSPSDYRNGPGYGPPEGSANGPQQPHGLHLITSHDTMSAHPQSLPPSAHYGHPPSVPPHPSPVYPPDYYGQHPMSQYAGQRRKPVRAAQACDSCRQRKAKCDEGRPECQHCKDNNLKCSYRDVPLQKQDKQAQMVTEKLDQMHDSIQSILEMQRHQGRILEMQQNARSSDKKPNYQYVQQDMYDGPTHTPPVKEELIVGLESTPKQVNSVQDQYRENKSDGNIPEDLAWPIKHTTAAQKLLSWPAVKILLPRDRMEDYTESYVMDLERNRGLIRLYGCGEGEDKNDGGAGAPSPGNSSDSGSRNGEDQASASPRGGVWGNGQLPARSPGPEHSDRDHAGGVSANGGLILDPDLVETYVASYMNNIHILHPFLDSKVLQEMVTRFKRRYSRGQFAIHKGFSTGKRKRTSEDSPGLQPDANPPSRPYHTSTGVAELEHSITNAIVLLILALGKICAHKAPLPGPMSDSSIPTSNPYLPFSDLSASPSAANSPNLYPGIRTNVPSTIVAGPSDPRGKNMDIMPGLAYFAVAADIIGELPGGGDVSHIQANLLAGLYMGQLARISPSHFYISNACKACMILVESSEYKTVMKPARRNLINFAFWTCLQLESDILAEVLLPPSGITRLEQYMFHSMPTGVTLDTNPDQFVPTTSRSAIILRFYSQQIQLRRTLNDIHHNIYGKNKEKERLDAMPEFKIMAMLNENLDGWKEQLGELDWNDWNYKSSDINVARMRAKYYGAKYLIHRPALRYLLATRSGIGSANSSTPGSRPSESPIVAADHAPQLPSLANQHMQSGNRGPRRQSEMAPPARMADLTENEKDLQKSAGECVRAAIRSTQVFDDVPERIIITNIFGTAHA